MTVATFTYVEVRKVLWAIYRHRPGQFKRGLVARTLRRYRATKIIKRPADSESLYRWLEPHLYREAREIARKWGAKRYSKAVYTRQT